MGVSFPLGGSWLGEAETDEGRGEAPMGGSDSERAAKALARPLIRPLRGHLPPVGEGNGLSRQTHHTLFTIITNHNHNHNHKP
jgi:hypothetical protein